MTDRLCFDVVIILEMARLDTLLSCFARQVWLCSYLILKFLTKTKAFVLIKKECRRFQEVSSFLAPHICKLVSPENKIVF